MRMLLIVLMCLHSAIVLAQESVPAPIVFFDIAGTDSAALQEFYADLFGWAASPTGDISVPVISPLPVDAPRFEVPGVVILGLFTDPAGNPMALVEMEDGEAKIP